MEHLSKQGADPATRVRQSQSAQALSRFLRCEVGAEDDQMRGDLYHAKELLVRELVGLECYKQQHPRSIGLNPAMRIAQVLVLSGKHPSIAEMLGCCIKELEHMANAIIQEQKRNSMSDYPAVVVPAGGDVNALLQVVEDTLVRSKASHLPNELYVSIPSHENAAKGVYRIDGSTLNVASQSGVTAGLTYVKNVEHNSSYQISKVRC
jgi:hypothetical protein